ncbi:DUF3017 domain-containing protein [Streptomyces sp. NPDC006368]|uniref:DUF3017 domain-containing protein n=1 Tax=Streptomyces sp. NPDC006368 TaxID=3156760 RepID=UPI0033B850A4
MGVRADDDPLTTTNAGGATDADGTRVDGTRAVDEGAPDEGARAADGDPSGPPEDAAEPSGGAAPTHEGAPADAPAREDASGPEPAPSAGATAPAPPAVPADPVARAAAGHARASSGRSAGGDDRTTRTSRRPPTVTRDTARPEGGGRAAPGDAPAPARQWPLLTVLGIVALGLVVVGIDPFPQASRIGVILIGVALLTGATLRRVVPSVGMLAVRSRFTDMLTYGLLGVVIVLLALMTQPNPWLEIPFLEKAVRFAVR